MDPGGGRVSVVELRGVTKTYDRVRDVLRDVTMVVDPGEVVVLMGRSGSGKTTLLNLVAGLDTPSRGSLHVGGTDLAGLDEEERTFLRLTRVGIVFQRFHLIPELTVLENVRLPMHLAKHPGSRQRAHELLAFFGLADQAEDYPATLSGGETQRAAIARALGNEPTVILADEPTANLDDTNARTALDALRRVAEETDTAVLIATHDGLARTIAHRVVHIVDGALTAEVPTLSSESDELPAESPGEGQRRESE